MDAAILGRKNIAAMFGKTAYNAFFDKHGKEMDRLGITFKVSVGRPRRKVVGAFPHNLILWASFKSKKGEVI